MYGTNAKGWLGSAQPRLCRHALQVVIERREAWVGRRQQPGGPSLDELDDVRVERLDRRQSPPFDDCVEHVVRLLVSRPPDVLWDLVVLGDRVTAHEHEPDVVDDEPLHVAGEVGDDVVLVRRLELLRAVVEDVRQAELLVALAVGLQVVGEVGRRVVHVLELDEGGWLRFDASVLDLAALDQR